MKKLLVYLGVLVGLGLLLVACRSNEPITTASWPMVLGPGDNNIGNVDVASFPDPLSVNLNVSNMTVDSLTVEGQTSLGNGALVANGISMTSGTGYFNAASVTDTLTVLGQTCAENGFRAANGMTLTSGTGYFNSVSVTGTLTGLSQANLDNGARIGGNITQTSGSALFNAASVSTTLTVGGDFTVSGTCNGCGGSSTFTDEIDAQAGVSVTGGVTVSQNLTVTGWVGLGGTYFAVSTTQDITDDDTIWVGPGATIYPVTAGGPTATLSDTLSISDGYYLGQVIIVTNVDADDHSVAFRNDANVKLGIDPWVIGGDATAGPNRSLMFWWDGDNWHVLGMAA